MSLDLSAFTGAVMAAVNAGINAAAAAIQALGTALQAVFADPAVAAVIGFGISIMILGGLLYRATGVNPFDWVRQVLAGVGGLFGRIFGGLF